MGQADPSKTEKATTKRRKKQRNEGNVAKGRELTKVMVLFAGLLALRFMINFYHDQFTEIYEWTFTDAFSVAINKSSAYSLFTWSVQKIAILVLPVLLILVATAYLTERLQVGKLWTNQTFKTKIWKTFQRDERAEKLMVSPQAMVKMGKSVLQAFAVGLAPYIVIKQEMANLLPLFHADTYGIITYLLTVGYKMTCYALVPMMLIAIAEAWYKRWDYEESIKMTKNEVKDERRQAEGDPKIKSQQQAKMLEMIASRMFQDIPKADVVVTNPTHFAVALQYDALVAPAPLILAKGVNRVAERIKEVARENHIPIEPNPPLARALYKQVEIGETIPEELFQAVAAILAKLDKFKHRQ